MFKIQVELSCAVMVVLVQCVKNEQFLKEMMIFQKMLFFVDRLEKVYLF